MTKGPTPKLDQIRALREARFAKTRTQRKPIAILRDAVAAVPATKAPKKSGRFGKRSSAETT